MRMGHRVSVGGSGRGAPPSRVHEPHSDPPAPPPRLPRLPHPSYMRCRSISLSLAPSTPSEPPARPRPSLLRPAPTSGVLRVVAPSIRVVPASAEGHAHPARVCPRHRAHSLSLGMATDPMLADPTRGPCLALGCGLRARLCAPPASQPRQPRQPSPPWGSRLGAHALGLTPWGRGSWRGRRTRWPRPRLPAAGCSVQRSACPRRRRSSG